MIKKIFLFVLILCLSSCGYNPIYLKRMDTELLIKNYQLLGDKNINKNIISNLNIKKNSSEKAKYNLKLNSTKFIEIVAKDKGGNASVYKTTISVELLITEGDKVVKEKTFNSDFIYNNITNKFDLSQYQKDIDKNLINNLSEKIFIFLTV